MLDNFGWLAVALPLLMGVIGSFLVESLLRPKIRPLGKRHWATFSLHSGLWILLFTVELAVCHRPWFATITALVFLLLVVQISNAKSLSLREPFIFQDFEYFTGAIKHPRLYLPFLGVGRAIIVIVGVVAAVLAGLWFEVSLTLSVPVPRFLVTLLVLLCSGSIFLWLGMRRQLPVTFEPTNDLNQLGLLTSLWRYAEEESSYQTPASFYDFVGSSLERDRQLPTLVVVQSESFYDVRRLFPGIDAKVLSEFDSLKETAILQGQVEVAAWGANTVRTEFSFLSGLDPNALGVHRFNPYRKLARQGIPTLVGYLSALGYKTVCIHPYEASFYDRDTIFKKLGFDEFIDIKHFDKKDKAGPYVGDVALAEKVRVVLEMTSSQPIFIFVITMENHGPLHLEKIQAGDLDCFYSSLPPKGCDDLTIYLRHLSNANRMAGMLRKQLEALPGNSWLCWYGDHVPIMPKVYEALGIPDGQTDYLLWEKDSTTSNKENELAIKIENLGGLLLQKMGLLPTLTQP